MTRPYKNFSIGQLAAVVEEDHISNSKLQNIANELGFRKTNAAKQLRSHISYFIDSDTKSKSTESSLEVLEPGSPPLTRTLQNSPIVDARSVYAQEEKV